MLSTHVAAENETFCKFLCDCIEAGYCIYREDDDDECSQSFKLTFSSRPSFGGEVKLEAPCPKMEDGQ
jgi:hypothetical protein